MNLMKSSTLKGIKIKKPENLVRLFSEKKKSSAKKKEDGLLITDPPPLSPSSLSLDSAATGNSDLPDSKSKKGKALLSLKRPFSRKSNLSLFGGSLPLQPQSSTKAKETSLKNKKEERKGSDIFNSAGSELNIDELHQKVVDDHDESTKFSDDELEKLREYRAHRAERKKKLWEENKSFQELDQWLNSKQKLDVIMDRLLDYLAVLSHDDQDLLSEDDEFFL